MTRSTGAALLERPRTDRRSDGAVPAPRPAAPAPVATAPAAPAPAAAPATAAQAAPAEQAGEAPVRRRSVPRPPGRRGPAWLAALVAGALLLAVPAALGGEPTATNADGADYGLGVASDLGLTGDMDDAGVRQSITEAEARARLDVLAASRAAREPQTALPVEGARMTTCFCMRWGSMHYGIDLAAPLGTPIRSATDGVVVRAGRATGYGNAVYVQDPEGNVHVYGHMRYYDVEVGQVVHAGEVIAKVGNEGQSTGPHLHYQIQRGGMTGRPVDPQAFLAARGVRV